MSFRFPQPSNEDDFEEFCERLLQRYFVCRTLQLYAKRGEEQNGIDIIDIAPMESFRAAQCKHHEFTKTLPPQEIVDEVEKASRSGFDLDEYYVLTTAKKSKASQNRVIKLNSAGGYEFKIIFWAWPDIERILSGLSDLDREYVMYGGTGRDAEALATTIVRVTRTIIADSVLVASDQILQARLKSADQHIAEENLELARYELDQIEQLSRSFVDDRDQYLIKRLKARYSLLAGDYDAAARLFLSAYALEPNLIQARINRALAYDLLGQPEKGFGYADELRREGCRQEPLPGILARTAKQPISDDLMKWLNDFIDTSEDLNISYAMQYLDEKRYEEAFQSAQQAKEINPKSSRAVLIEAMVHHNRGVSQKGTQRRAELEKAYELYSLAIGNDVDRLPLGCVPDALRNLSSVQYLLSKGEPRKTFRNAIESAKDKGPYIGAYLNYLCSIGDYVAANEYLEQQPSDTAFEDDTFLKIVIQYYTQASSERKTLIERMFNLGLSPDYKRRIECVGFAVQWSIDSLLTELAITKLESYRESVEPLVVHVCLAWIEIERGATDSAFELALKAKAEIDEDSDDQFVLLLARLLYKLERHLEALTLFERTVDISHLSDETRMFLDCAVVIKQYDIALRICKALRENGKSTDKLLDFELQILGKYQPTQALELVTSLLTADPKNKRLYAIQSSIHTSLIGPVDDLDVTKLPSPAEIGVSEANLVYSPLLATGRYAEAIRFAYSQLRDNWHDEEAHGKYVYLFMQFARKSDLDLEPIQVGVGCAVEYVESANESKWLLIEDHSASLLQDETPSNSAMAERLMGAKVGQELVLSTNAVQPRNIKIKTITSKYVYRHLDVMQNFQLRFDSPFGPQLITIMKGGEFDFSPIIESLEQRRKNIDYLTAEFKKLPAPIAFLANWLGVSYIDAFEYLSRVSDIGIRCCPYPVPNLNVSLLKLRQSKILVLDQSALMTISKLELWSKLESYKLVVARTVIEDFKYWSRRLQEDFGDETGTVFLRGPGQLAFQRVNEIEKRKRFSELVDFINTIESHCEVQESKSMTSIDFDAREMYEQNEATTILESMLLAKEIEGAVLWTDELFANVIGEDDFQTSAIWTQALLDEFVRGKLIGSEEYNQYNARLLGWFYNPIVWNADIAFAAFIGANGSTNAFPFQAILYNFGRSSATIIDKAHIATQLFFRMYRENIKTFLRDAVVYAVLNAINDVRAADLVRLGARKVFGYYTTELNELFENITIWESMRSS